MKKTILIDGQHRPLSEGEWVWWDPTGWPEGCMKVSPKVADDPDRAAKEFCDGHAMEALRKVREGYRAELMTHERWAAEVMPIMQGEVAHVSTRPDLLAAGEEAFAEFADVDGDEFPLADWSPTLEGSSEK